MNGTEEFTFAVVRTAVAGIYSDFNFRAELSSQALLGEQVRVLEERGRWVLIQSEDGTEGAMHRGSLAARPSQEGPAHFCEKLYATIREAPSARSLPVAGSVLGGRLFSDAQVENGYLKVVLPDHEIGFADRNAFVPEPEFRRLHPFRIPSLIETANRLRGRPYLWGGTSSLGLDCSGLTRLVCAIHGLILPRNSSDQSLVGTHGPEERELRSAGDLLFFAVDSDRIDHVALSLGPESFLHASAAAGCVVEQSLSPERPDFAPHLRSAFQCCRRLTER